jgi:hypothetical protein
MTILLHSDDIKLLFKIQIVLVDNKLSKLRNKKIRWSRLINSKKLLIT